MILADVIFPAPSAAYVVDFLLPFTAILALAAEFGVFLAFQRGVISAGRLLGIVVGVNLFSWVVGMALSVLLPSGLVPHLVAGSDPPFYEEAPGPHWGTLAVLSFFWACALSIAIEYGALRLLRRWFPLRRLGLCVALANLASYAAVGAVVALSFV
jgi:hypothetical protein